jgi:hypothetical protein
VDTIPCTTIKVPRPKMAPGNLRDRWFNAQQRITSARAALTQAEQELALVRQWAAEDGLSRELRQLEMPPKPPQRDERLRKWKVLKSFVHRHLSLQTAPGDVVELALDDELKRQVECGFAEQAPDDPPVHSQLKIQPWR